MANTVDLTATGEYIRQNENQLIEDQVKLSLLQHSAVGTLRVQTLSHRGTSRSILSKLRRNSATTTSSST